MSHKGYIVLCASVPGRALKKKQRMVASENAGQQRRIIHQLFLIWGFGPLV